MRVFIAVILSLAVVAAAPPQPKEQSRIVGGSVTTIENYPTIVALLFSWGTTGHRQNCGGTILNNRSILTAAHCVSGDAAARWQSRVGSTNANSGGVVHASSAFIVHVSFNWSTLDSDVAIIRTATNIVFTNVIQAASFAGSNYNLADNQVVWAAGWGHTTFQGSNSEQLRHVQVWSVNQNTCRTRYLDFGWTVTDTMLCAGWLDVGGRDACQNDSGGPLYHNGVVVGITSWGRDCALARYPGVYVRVSRFASWISSNA